MKPSSWEGASAHKNITKHPLFRFAFGGHIPHDEPTELQLTLTSIDYQSIVFKLQPYYKIVWLIVGLVIIIIIIIVVVVVVVVVVIVVVVVVVVVIIVVNKITH